MICQEHNKQTELHSTSSHRFVIWMIWFLEAPRVISLWKHGGIRMILLMEEFLHHLVCIEPCKEWDKLAINWCRMSSINSSAYKNYYWGCHGLSIRIDIVVTSPSLSAPRYLKTLSCWCICDEQISMPGEIPAQTYISPGRKKWATEIAVFQKDPQSWLWSTVARTLL